MHFCQWLEQTQFSVWLRDAPYPYPVLLIIHVISIALFGGMVVMGNLRVLGLVLRKAPVSQVIGQFRAWKWTGFGILAVTGTLLTVSDPVEYYGNIMFWLSLALLLVAGLNALIFRNGVYRGVADWDAVPIAPVKARWWANISLLLWVALIFAGRAIAFF